MCSSSRTQHQIYINGDQEKSLFMAHKGVWYYGISSSRTMPQIFMNNDWDDSFLK
jgi:hypothetical protein